VTNHRHSSPHGSWFLLLVLVTAACAVPRSAALTDAQAASIRDSVIALDNAMNLAVDGLDCTTGMVPVGDQDPLFVSNTMVVRTRAALQTACEGMVAPRTGATFKVDKLSAYPLSAESAYLVREGDYTINFKDGRSETQRLIMTTVWTRQHGEWKMVHLHESYARQ
jgi:ketosteroid isomerase-like protein